MSRRHTLPVVAVLLIGDPLPARAYNWCTHSRIVEKAIEIMQFPPPVGSPPPGVSTAEWSQFLDAAADAPARLRQLRTGLPFRPASYPFNDDLDTPENEAASCAVYADDNLDQIGLMRIEDLRYVPERSAGPCGLTKVGPSTELLQSCGSVRSPESSEVLPRVLGWHAGSVDDRASDSVLWFRPTNAGFLGQARRWASDAWVYAVGALIAPFACAWEAIFGDGCDLDSGFELARQYNPVEYVEGWIPGFGDVRDAEMFAGLWHFINLEANGVFFNDIPGMLYDEASPRPGVFDVFVMAGVDLVGLSLKAGESEGDDIYGQYDRLGRGFPAWQAHTIAHLEFSPIDNMARYGRDLLAAGNYTSAQGLAWPLHAVGDASEPHHVVGTSSWGHRPYEDFVEDRFDVLVAVGDVSQQERIRAMAFEWWSFLRSGGTIEAFVTAVARRTRLMVETRGDWAYQSQTDLTSYLYFMDVLDNRRAAIAFYGLFTDQARELVELAAAATLGFLTFVSEHVPDQDRDPSTSCPPGTHYEPAGGCQPGAPPSPPPLPDLGVCPADEECEDGCPETCLVDAECSVDEYCFEGCCIPVIF